MPFLFNDTDDTMLMYQLDSREMSSRLRESVRLKIIENDELKLKRIKRDTYSINSDKASVKFHQFKRIGGMRYTGGNEFI